MSPANEIAAAYAKWTKVHRQLVQAEQDLAALTPQAGGQVRSAAQAKVARLRAEADQLLLHANSLLRAYEATRRKD